MNTALGVDRNATSDDISEAYRLAVEFFHPLKSRELTESDSVMQWKLSSAWVRLETMTRNSQRLCRPTPRAVACAGGHPAAACEDRFVAPISKRVRRASGLRMPAQWRRYSPSATTTP